MRLQAQDAEDLKILSAMLQDAVVQVRDIAWLPRQRRFAFGGSRFRREDAGSDGRPPARIGFGAHIDTVLSVARRGIAQDRPEQVLVLLAVTLVAPEAGSAEGQGPGELSLIFAGGGAINLRVECIDMTLADLGATYATRLAPEHDLADSDGGTEGGR